MKVLLQCSRAGTLFSQEKGQTVEVEADEAGRMFLSGQCSFFSDEDKAEALKAEEAWRTSRAAAEATVTTFADEDEDDSDAINGGAEQPPAEPGATALQKSKAKKSKAEKAG